MCPRRALAPAVAPRLDRLIVVRSLFFSRPVPNAMPTLEEYASDPDDMTLDLPPAVQDPAANQIPAAFKGKSPALPQDFANEAAIPKAMRVAIDGSFVKPLNDEYTKRVQFLSCPSAHPFAEPWLAFQVGHALPDLYRQEEAAARRRTASQRETRDRVAVRRTDGKGVPDARVRSRV